MVVPVQRTQFEVLLQRGAENLDGTVVLGSRDGVGGLSHTVSVHVCAAVVLKVDIVCHVLNIQLETRARHIQVYVTAKMCAEHLLEITVPPGIC